MMNRENATTEYSNSSALIDVYPQFPFTLTSGEGTLVRDADGREYWDLYGGHAVALLGHAHPAVAEAIRHQAAEMLFYSNAAPIGVRDRAAERLCAFAPEGISRVFFCNSGAEANENALKLAIQLTGRKRIASLKGGFHGRTTLALAATWNPKLRAAYEGLLCPTVRLEPNVEADATLIDESVAAVIVEPIQSMAGVVSLNAEFLQALRRRCDEVGAYLIYDEVQTGMGRLGRPFAAGEYDVLPDMVTSAKGLANGVPMGAVLTTSALGSRIQLGDLGTTFGGGPLACAALLSVLEVITDEQLVDHAAALGEHAHESLRRGPVEAIHGRGCLLGLEVAGDAKKLQSRLLESGFITGTSANPQVLRILPPINTSIATLDAFGEVLAQIGRN